MRWILLVALVTLGCWKEPTLSPQFIRKDFVATLPPDRAEAVGEHILEGVPVYGMTPVEVDVMLSAYDRDQVSITRSSTANFTIESWRFRYPWIDGIERRICGLTFRNSRLETIQECPRL